MTHEAKVMAIETQLYSAIKELIRQHVAIIHSSDPEAMVDHEAEFAMEGGATFRELADILIFVCSH